MFSHTWRVCSSMSPMPAMLPSGRRAVMPETNTSLPFASIAIACEKCALGCGDALGPDLLLGHGARLH